MSVENAVYINTLNDALPAHTDGLDEADSHMRLIKQVLQATFPNVAGAVGATDVDLTNLSAALVTLAALVISAPNLTLANTFTGPCTFSGGLSSTTFLNAVNVQKGGFELVPTGIIAMWWGQQTNIPGGWNICDGTNGTPDMRGLYVIGAGTEVVNGVTVGYPAGSTGGANSVTVTTVPSVAHNHTGFTDNGGGQVLSATTDLQGSHSHGGSDAPTALTIDQIPAHDHGLTGHGNILVQSGSGNAAQGGSGSVSLIAAASVGNGSPHSHTISVDGSHLHNVAVSSVVAHTHPVFEDGIHTHVVVVPTQPASVAFCYIMKL